MEPPRSIRRIELRKELWIIRALGLETSFEEVLDFETEDVIEFHLVFWEDTNSDQSTEKSVTFKQSLWVFFFKSKKGTGNFSDLGDGQFDSPDFTLVTKITVLENCKDYGFLNLPETEFTDQFQFLVKTCLFVASWWGDKSLGLDHWSCARHDRLFFIRVLWKKIFYKNCEKTKKPDMMPVCLFRL